MTEVFAEDGTMYAVTVVEVLPNAVTQKKTLEKDGYVALQVGYEEKTKNVNKPMKGIFEKANVSPKQRLYELKGDELASYEVGQEIKADIFQAGDVVDVIGHSKGRGYAGVIKRWGHHIGPKGHGSGYHRGQGSFSNNGRCNNRVIPGKKMAGHMGNQQATVLNQRVIAVDATKNYILISGGVPGSKLSIVKIRSAIKGIKHPEPIKPLLDREALKRAAEEAAAAEAAAKKEAELAAQKAAEEAAKAAESQTAEAPVTEAPAAEEAK